MELRLLVWLGVESSAVALGLALLFTYVVHSVIWVATAALLARVRAISSATRHLLWKMALFGPILSALFAVAVSSALARSPMTSSYVHELKIPALAAPLASPPVDTPAATNARAAAVVRVLTPRVRGSVILTLVLASAALGCLRFLGSAILIRRRLRGRTRVTEARLLARLEHVRGSIGVRGILLTESSRVDSPLVLGAMEICVPRTLHEELTDAELDTVLAHELAHIERRDGLWFPLAGALECILWFYPLNYWVTSRFRDSAELACDDRAVELTRNPLGLARALVQVAASSSFGRRLAMMPAISRSKSGLLPRLRRLTGASAPREKQPSRRAGPWATGAILTLAAALVSLNIQVAEAHPERRPLPAGARPRFSGSAPAVTPPDSAEQSRRMSELVHREQLLAAQLEAARRLPNELQEGAPESARVLELSQELRHVRAAESLLETRFAEEWAAWDKARSEVRRASR